MAKILKVTPKAQKAYDLAKAKKKEESLRTQVSEFVDYLSSHSPRSFGAIEEIKTFLDDLVRNAEDAEYDAKAASAGK